LHPGLFRAAKGKTKSKRVREKVDWWRYYLPRLPAARAAAASG